MCRLRFSIRTLMIAATLLATVLTVLTIPDWTRAHYIKSIKARDYAWIECFTIDPPFLPMKIDKVYVTSAPAPTVLEFMSLKRKLHIEIAYETIPNFRGMMQFTVEFNRIRESEGPIEINRWTFEPD